MIDWRLVSKMTCNALIGDVKPYSLTQQYYKLFEERERERERERILFATALQAYQKGYKPI